MPHAAPRLHPFDTTGWQDASFVVWIDIADRAFRDVGQGGDARMGMEGTVEGRSVMIEQVKKHEGLQDFAKIGRAHQPGDGAMGSAPGAPSDATRQWWQGQFGFGAWRLSLAEAVAKAGGLNDAVADPASVFLYRGETRHLAQLLGVDCTPFVGPIIPIIYEVNLRDPAGYFLAKQFNMRNKDIIYASNALSVETSKVLNFLQLVMGTANDPITYATNFYGLKAAIRGTATSAVLIGQ